MKPKRYFKAAECCPISNGVYFLLKDNQIVYVGQSMFVASRIANHKKDKDFDSYRVILCYAPLMGKWERRLIQKFRPKYNKNGYGPEVNMLNFSVSEHLKGEIEAQARKKGLSPSKFVREIIKKYIKYKEPELV